MKYKVFSATALTLAMSLATPTSALASVFWTDWAGDSNVWKSDLDGTNPSTLITGQFSDPGGIDLDLKNGKMYIADNGGVNGVGSTPSVARANLDGSGLEYVVLGGRPSDVALDVTGGKMYWTDWAGDSNVWRADLDGSNAEVLISGQFSDPSGIALDLANGKMYIADEGGIGGVGSVPSVAVANLDGSGLSILATGGRPTGVAVDELNGKLYWTDWMGDNNVWQSDLDGSNATAIIMGQFSDLNGIDVDPYLGKIYLAETGGVNGVGFDPSVASANLDGSDVQILVTGGRPSDVAIVPEPTTALLMLVGGASLLCKRRKSEKA
ncbi:MAG TPA: PEP-CTERM sorting domain-containing protein [Phycisphaerae bacterium]|nr:PEP-CTERM sorting domain-containing protein [Phycisphaerae bacterium]